MSPWKKNIAVKLPPFWSWSETCRNVGHVTLTCWVFSRAFWAGIFVQKFVESVSKNILLDIDEFQTEEASSLLILKAIFLSKCHTNILSWPIHELHKLRGNKVFCCWFFVSSMEATLSSTSNLIGWCFLFCPFTHFIWNCIYVTLTLAFYAWQRATYLGISFWYRNLSSFLRVKFRGQFTALSFLKTWSKLKMQNDVLNIARSTKKRSNCCCKAAIQKIEGAS